MIIASMLARTGILAATTMSILFASYAALHAAATVAEATATTGTPIRILAFGDSLTAGYRLKPDDAFPAQLEMALEAKGYKVRVINAGVSGDTTAAGLARVEWSAAEGADAAIVELGANDALRGLPVANAKSNLDTIITQLKGKGMEILIAGMKAPGNWGADYQRDFNAMYDALAQKHGAILYPFFLDGVEVNSAMVLDDGLHPSAKGVAEVVKRILPDVERLIATVTENRSKAATGAAAGDTAKP